MSSLLTLLTASNLNNFNYALAVIHLIAAASLIFFLYRRGSSKLSFPVSLGDNKYIITGNTLIWSTVAFFGITVIAHLCYANFFNRDYIRMVNGSGNKFRWIEYSLSATIMGIIIAFLSQIESGYLILALAGLVFGTMFTGWWFENLYGSGPVAYLPILIGFILLGIYLLIIYLNYTSNIKVYEKKNNKKLPNWIKFAILGTLGFFSVFGLVPLWKLWINNNKIIYEYFYIILSALAKLTLGILLGYGILFRKE